MFSNIVIDTFVNTYTHKWNQNVCNAIENLSEIKPHLLFPSMIEHVI